MRGALLLFASALALTLAMAAPVLEAPAERLFGREIVGRHHDAYTMVTWFERPFWQPFTQPATDLPGAALARLGGGVVALNLLVLASFPLAALFAFLLARHLGVPGWAAGLAALAFAFAPSHVAHAAYHPHVVQVQWIPLYLLALVRCLDRWTAGRAALLLAAGGLLTLSNFYAGLFGALLTPVVLIAYRPVSGEEGREARLATTTTVLAGGLAGGLFLWWTAGSPARLADHFAFPAADLARYSARWYSYLLPPVDHPLVGGRVAEFWRGRDVADGLVEQQLTLGLAVLLLAAVAVFGWWRRRSQVPAARAVPFLAALGVAALLGSLAPQASGPWPAPALPAILHPVLPMFRAYARLGIFAQLAVALLAAIGAAALWRRGRASRVAAALLVTLAAVELAPFPPWRWHHLLPTEAHRWIADQPGGWRLLDCAERPPAVARSIARFLPRPTTLLSARLPDCAEPGLAGGLAARAYTHLLLRHDRPESRWYDERGLPDGLAEERRFSDSRLLRVTAAPAPLFLDGWQGFSWREFQGDRTFRWLGPAGEWRLVNDGDAELAARLELELWSLGSVRDLELELDGRSLGSVRVGLEPAWHTIGELSVRPGLHRLLWRPSGDPVVPDELLGNGDTRPLTVAVGSWRWSTTPAAAPPSDPRGG